MLRWMTSPRCHPRSVGAPAIGYGMHPLDNGPCTWSVDGSRSRLYHQPSASPTLTLQTSAPAGTAHIHATGRLLRNSLASRLMGEAGRMGQQRSFGIIKSKHRHYLPRIGSSGPKRNGFGTTAGGCLWHANREIKERTTIKVDLDIIST